MRPVDRKLPLSHSGVRLVRDGNLPDSHRTLLVPITVVERSVSLDDCLEEFVNVVDTARCVHPTGILIESLVHEKLAPRHSAVGVESLLADHVELFAEKERGVGIDEKQSITRRCVSRRDGNAVRPSRLLIHIRFVEPGRHHG